MQLKKNEAGIFVPDGLPVDDALCRTTHMAVASHQDDLEIMAYDGILKCFGREDQWFFGVVTTDGSGSPRDGLYADFSDEDMRLVRRNEQKKAAFTGEYGAVALLDYSSAEVKDPTNADVIADIKTLVSAARPRIMYTHNPADKHDTHVATALRAIRALRELPGDLRPEKLYGCEVWRGLDWLNDDEKVVFDVAGHPNIAASLLGVHDSQICGGVRYDLATAGRRMANATFAESHGVDITTSAIYAVDLTPLMENPETEVAAFMRDHIEKFSADVMSKIDRMES